MSKTMTHNTTLDQPVVLAEAAFGRCELRTSTVEGDQIHIHAKALASDRVDHDLGWYDPAGLMQRLAHFVSAPEPVDGSLGVDGDGRLWLYREWGRNGRGGWVLHENNGLRQRSAGRTAEYVATHFRGFTRLHPLHIPAVSPDPIVERIRVGEDTYLPAVNVVAWMNAAAAAVGKAKGVNAVHWADVAGEIERMADERAADKPNVAPRRLTDSEESRLHSWGRIAGHPVFAACINRSRGESLLDAMMHRLDTLEHAEKAGSEVKHLETILAETRDEQRQNLAIHSNDMARYQTIVEAAEDRITALLRLNATSDDLHQADEALTAAHEAHDAAIEADIETGKALNIAKAQFRGDS